MKLALANISLGLWTAAYIKQTADAFFAARPNELFSLGLPTGDTVIDMYANLRLFYKTGQLDFSRFITFNMDEYAQLLPEHPQSYHSYMKRNLFDAVNIPPENQHLLNGLAQDPQAECARYEQAIRHAGGIELFIGGVGRNGHLAFNEPGSAFTSRTRLVNLTKSTREANARFFDNQIQKVPAQAFTVGIGTLLEAKQLLILASGSQKAEVLRQAIQNKPNPDCPLSALKLHPNALLVADKEACLLLPQSVKDRLEAQQRRNPLAEIFTIDLQEA